MRQYGTVQNSEYLYTGVASSDGSVYVGGYFSEALSGQMFAGDIDAYVRKCDSAGGEAWTRMLGTSGGEDMRALTLASNGDVYSVGYTTLALAGQTSAGGVDVFVRRYTPAGVDTWTHQFGTSASDTPQRAAFVAENVLYVAGTTTGAFPGYGTAMNGDVFISQLVVP